MATYADLFCGAGGLSLGLSAAGLTPLRSFDFKKAAIATYRSNIGCHADVFDLTTHPDLPAVDVIAGGPPCQGFSSAGLRRVGDARNTLVRRFADIIAHYRPRLFLFENVEGFLTVEEGAFLFDLLEPLVGAGYHIHVRKVNAANFGVAQHRKRVVALGGLGFDPGFPAATHTAFGAPGAERAASGLPLSPTLREVLQGLPPASSEPPGQPIDHCFRYLEGEDLERVAALKPGQTMRDLPAELQHKSYLRRANRRVMDGTPTERRGGAPAGLRRLRADEPSKAITGGARAEFVHPWENRHLTLRECARIQGFPDGFVFEGTLAERAQLIGNAVPTRLAQALGKHIARVLVQEENPRNDGAGRLLSFHATAAEGTSPVLRTVIDQVEQRLLKPLLPKPQQETLWP